MTVGEPTEAILDLSEPRSRIFPCDLFDIFDRIEGEVDIQMAALTLRLTGHLLAAACVVRCCHRVVLSETLIEPGMQL